MSENEWAQEGIFLGLSILFVYPFAMLGDALIFNSIEFWGGTNPIDPPTTAKLDDDGGVQADGSLAMR